MEHYMALRLKSFWQSEIAQKEDTVTDDAEWEMGPFGFTPKYS